MDPQSFIQSGLLEAYILGQCTAEERAEVERMAAAHAEVRAELEAIEQSLEKVAMANAVPPPDGLRGQILQRIQAEAAGVPNASGGRIFRLFPALGWAATVVLGIVLAALWSTGRSEQNRLNGEISALQTKVDNCAKQAREQAKQQELIALLRDRDTRSIVLADGPQPKITATVWFNTKRGETALDINSLPAPDPGKYFQFWAIVDGKPVSMGMVNIRGDQSWQSLPFIGNAQAFAISAENNSNGNPTPTQVVLVGKVG